MTTPFTLSDRPYFSRNWSLAFSAANFPADGQYTVHVRATDDAGNTHTSPTRTVTVDASAPSDPVVTLSESSPFAFVSGTEHVLRQRPMIIPPLPNETWSLVCGFEDDVRHFQALRDGVPIMNVVENGTTSLIGSTHRGAGFGMANNGTHGPASVKRWSAGDNATITQTGFLRRVNAGDQPMFDRYTVYGPGIFTFADGPNSSDTITFGPLLAGQIAQIRTDPRKRSVVDLTSTPANPQQANQFAQALEDFISFATGNNVPPLLQEIESLFGIQPPQGNMYALLQGRFSDAAAIPPKPTGQPASEYHVKVTIDEGNAASRIVAAGTPLRRWPY